MGCHGHFIVTWTAILTPQWYDCYWFTEYAPTWARHPTTPWQRECMAIIDRQSIASLLDSMRFVAHFWEITPFILRDAIVVLVQSQCYSLNARSFGPRTPYPVGGLAGDVMRVGKPFFSKSLDLKFQSFTIVLLTIYLYWIKGTLRGYAIQSGRRPEGPPCGRWLARQTIDLDVHRRKWTLTIHGLKGEAGEDEEVTRDACVKLAQDHLGIPDAASTDLRLVTASASMLAAESLWDSGISAPATLGWGMLKNCVITLMQLAFPPTPALRPMKKELLTKRKDMPQAQRSKYNLWYLRQWPYVVLSGPEKSTIVPSVSKEAIVENIIGLSPTVSIPETMWESALNPICHFPSFFKHRSE